MEEGPLRIWVGTVPEVDLGDRVDRLSLVPIVRAAVDPRTDEELVGQPYGPLRTHYVLCGPDEAEVAMVPRLIKRGDDSAVRPFVDEAERRGLRTLVFGRHDLEPIVGSAAAIVLHAGPTRGALLVCPRVTDTRGIKCSSASLEMCRPKDTPLAAASK